MLEESDRTVSDILSDRGSRDNAGEEQGAAQWLKEFLAGGRVEANEIIGLPTLTADSKDQAKRAKKKLDVAAVHPDIKGPWFWELPPRERSRGAREHASETPLPCTPCRSLELHSLRIPAE